MSKYNFNVQYYISTGSLGVLYTLRYKALEMFPHGDSTFTERNIDVYLCTLSKDPDEALLKAQAYLTERGIDYKHHNLSTDFVLNERAESIYGAAELRRSQLTNQVLVGGKYDGVHVSELPESYLKWFHLNVRTGLNHEIIENYISENDLENEWVKLGSFNLYNKLVELQSKFEKYNENCILEFNGVPKEQKIYNKDKSFNGRTISFLIEYKKSISLYEFKDAFNMDDDTLDIGINLAKAIAVNKFNFNYINFLNKAICGNWIYKAKNKDRKYYITPFGYEDVLQFMQSDPYYIRKAIEFS